jgi:hypothetical protein
MPPFHSPIKISLEFTSPYEMLMSPSPFIATHSKRKHILLLLYRERVAKEVRKIAQEKN